MVDKLSLTDVVRYLFSGIVVLASFGLAQGVTVERVIAWAKDNAWASGLSPTALGGLVLLMAGYFSFTIYRTVVFEWLVLPLKHVIAIIAGGRFDTYRERIRQLMKPQEISIWEAERIYRIIKRGVAPEFYGDVARAPTIAAGLHLLYFTGLALFVGLLCAGRWYAAGFSAAIFVLALAMDIFFEKEESLHFTINRAQLEKHLKPFRASAKR